MIRELLPMVQFRPEETQVLTCGTYDGDMPAFAYLSLEDRQEMDDINLSKNLSFVLVKNGSFERLGYIMVKEESYGNRPKGVKIHSIGYVNEEAFHLIINQLKSNLSIKRNGYGEYLYDYIWGYIFNEFSFLLDDFNIEYRENFFYYNLRQ